MALAQLQQAFVAYLRRDDMPLPAGTDERHMRYIASFFSIMSMALFPMPIRFLSRCIQRRSGWRW